MALAALAVVALAQGVLAVVALAPVALALVAVVMTEGPRWDCRLGLRPGCASPSDFARVAIGCEGS